METIDWIRDPSLQPKGHKDSIVFVSAVTTIYKQSRVVDGVRRLTMTQDARDLLEYLLLRRHPVTGSEIPLEFQINSDSNKPERIQILESSALRMISRCLKGEQAYPYPVMQLLVEAGEARNAGWLCGEEISLLTLSLVIFSEAMQPIDISNIQACFRLKNDSSAVTKQAEALEFCGDSCYYMKWISEEIDKLCYTTLTSDELRQEASYAGLFASLIRASRMSDDTELQGILKSETEWLQQLRQHGRNSNVLDSRH